MHSNNSKKFPAFVQKTMLGLLLCFSALSAVKKLFSYDIWWHLAQGRWSWENMKWLNTDVLSHTFYGKPLAHQEILGELLSYGIVSGLGLEGLSIIVCMISIFLTLLLYKIARGRGVSSAGAVVISLIATYGISRFIIAEFSVYTLFFLALFLFVMQRYFREKKISHLILIVLLQILWINFHRGGVLGALLCGVIAIELFFKRNTPILHPLVLMLGLWVIMLNPAGAGIFTSTFDVTTRFEMAQFTAFWQPLSFKYAFWNNPFLGLDILLTCIIILFRRKKLSIFDLTIFVICAAVCFRGIRWSALPVIASVPIISEWAATLRAAEHFRKACAVFVFFLGGLIVIEFVKISPFRGLGYAPWLYPVRSADFLLKHRPEGNLYNSFNFGGYLAWRLYPHYRIFIDGRNESLYSFDFFKEAWHAEANAKTWTALTDRFKINTAVVEVYSGKKDFEFLQSMNGWKLVFMEERAAVFVRDIPQHHRLIEKYAYRELTATNAHEHLESIYRDTKRLKVFLKESRRFIKDAPLSPKAFYLATLACRKINAFPSHVCETYALRSNELTQIEFEGESILGILTQQFRLK